MLIFFMRLSKSNHSDGRNYLSRAPSILMIDTISQEVSQ